jgi:hypothetical protein
LPCLAWAQYPSNGNQKITLGEQTTADGLIFRGVASIDTVTATSKITRANKEDTSAFILLDTVTNLLWHYKIGSNGWSQAGGGTAVTTFSAGTTGLTPSTATSGAVTLGGTLAVANGGTGSATQNFVDLTNTQTVAGAKTLTSALTGTSATFSSTIFGNAPLNNTVITTTDATNITNGFNLLGSQSYWGIRTATSGNFNLDVYGNGSTKNALSIAQSTGAATFSSSVTATDLRLTNLTNVTDLRTDADGDLYNGASDVNLKNNIEPITYGLNEVLKIKPVEFYWNKEKYNYSGYKTIGFIAQDLIDIIPNAATVSGDGNMQIEYTAIIATLTKAIQEQQALIKALEQRIINLENK